MSATFIGMDEAEAREFASRWLPAWSGGDAERLLAFYAPDAYYSDPVMPNGVTGHDALRAYFVRLLRKNPAWAWTQRRSTPMPDGFINFWHAQIPVGGEIVEVDGVCLVQLREGLIYRNEVYFDRSLILPRANGEG